LPKTLSTRTADVGDRHDGIVVVRQDVVAQVASRGGQHVTNRSVGVPDHVGLEGAGVVGARRDRLPDRAVRSVICPATLVMSPNGASFGVTNVTFSAGLSLWTLTENFTDPPGSATQSGSAVFVAVIVGFLTLVKVQTTPRATNPPGDSL
jgi:hypothetical protein